MPTPTVPVMLASAALSVAALWAPTTASAQVIIACKNLTNGNVRIVGDAVLCRQHEVATSWNAQGEPGPAGPQGPAGPAGPPGPPGPGSEPPESIVVSEPVTGWAEPFEPSFDAFSASGGNAAVFARGTGVLAIGLSGPAAIGGTTYRLSEVEYCITPQTGGGTAFVATADVLSDRGSALGITSEVVDLTDRTEAGCYVLSVADGTARTHVLRLFVSPGPQVNSGMFVGAVRTTWVVAAP